MTAILFEPHADDAALFASYLCLRHHPLVITCLRSERMGSPGYPEPLVTQETRERETACAMKVLGCDWEQWQFSDAKKDWLEEMHAWFSDLGADQIFAPAPEEGGHEQHNVIGHLATEVFGESVIYYMTYTNGREHSRGQEVPFEPHWPALKLAALSCYRSQIEHPSTGHHFIDHGLREYIQ